MVLYFIFLFALIRAVFLCFQFNFASFGWGSFYRKHLWCCLGANECACLRCRAWFYSIQQKCSESSFFCCFLQTIIFNFTFITQSQSLSLNLFIHPYMKRSILHFHSSILFIHPFIQSPWTSRMCKSLFATLCVCASVIVSVCI